MRRREGKGEGRGEEERGTEGRGGKKETNGQKFQRNNF